MKPTSTCAHCNEGFNTKLDKLYGFALCENCRSGLNLMTDKTIEKHIESYAKAKEQNNSLPSYSEEVEAKLKLLEKAYVSRKIKLLHIGERLKHL